MAVRRYRIIGPGRAGLSMHRALTSVGWASAGVWGRSDAISESAHDVDVVILAVPDGAIASVAEAIDPGTAVVMHMAGSRTLAELAPHLEVASVHPLISLPDPEIGSMRLLSNCQFAVAGHDIASEMVLALGGTPLEVAESARSAYHAGAAVASNHAVALWGQVERIAALAGIPAQAYWQIMQTSLENAVGSSAASAITGPASRGDWETCRSHLDAIGKEEAELYLRLAAAAATLAGQTLPEDLR